MFIGIISCKKPPESETKGPNCIAQPIKYISAEISNFKKELIGFMLILFH
jgi:hypothetical protein